MKDKQVREIVREVIHEKFRRGRKPPETPKRKMIREIVREKIEEHS